MATAFLYNDGSFVFSSGDTADSSKTLVASYTGWDTTKYTSSRTAPWYNDGNYTNIISVSFNGSVAPISTAYWFYKCINLTSFDSENLDTSNVTKMDYMFFDCSSLTSLDLSSFNTSNVTDMNSMFRNCSSLTSLDLSSFNTSNVIYMDYMFFDCSSLTSLDLSSFNTSNVICMDYMFYGCSNLTSLDLSSFNTSNVTLMSSMFNACRNLITIYVLNLWLTASVTYSTEMFNNCTSLIGAVPYDSTKIDVSMANYETGYFTHKRYGRLKDMLIKNTTLYNMADEIRILYGTEDTMTPAVMNSNLNTFNTELSAINVEQDGLIEQLKNLFGIVTPEADTLDGCSWENISKIAAQGNASNFWSVGDTKKIVLNGTVGTLSLSNYETYVYIIGFDNNGATGTIDFGTFKTADGVDIALVDNAYNSEVTNGTLNFNMNHWSDYNYGGWAGCDLRYDILGSTDVAPSGYGAAPVSGRVGYDASTTCATNPVANTLMAALPSELRAIMKPMTVYTDNVGGTDAESNVTTTVDYLPLLAEFEIFGTRTNANSYEQNNQTQYSYYINGNNKMKYSYDNTSYASIWWERSPSYRAQFSFGGVWSSGVASVITAKISSGLAPIFRV